MSAGVRAAAIDRHDQLAFARRSTPPRWTPPPGLASPCLTKWAALGTDDGCTSTAR
ncbi:hypothetical protein ACFVGN_24280 [Streptomyces sp. NPDC057757]|uniref:hypothetical protein n=1 Tax=Streptomyces sp. NPDC057757 TaxID=3346241 RepID=UPI0036810E8E